MGMTSLRDQSLCKLRLKKLESGNCGGLDRCIYVSNLQRQCWMTLVHRYLTRASDKNMQTYLEQNVWPSDMTCGCSKRVMLCGVMLDRWIATNVSVETVASIFMVESFSDMMIPIYQVTRRHVPEDSTLSDTIFVNLHQPVNDVHLLQGGKKCSRKIC